METAGAFIWLLGRPVGLLYGLAVNTRFRCEG